MKTLLTAEETPGRMRPMIARWVVIGTLELESAAHFGGIEDPAVDLKVQRDPVSGAPMLLGTSLAGALRCYLGDYLGGYRSPEDQRVPVLFGGAAGDDQGAQSPLIVFDSLGEIPEGLSAEVRDGVKIDAPRGTAEEHKKFERELLPAGTLFGLRFELVVAEGGAEERRQLSLLAAALSGLEKAQIPLGARRSRGLGRAQAGGWKVRRFDLSGRGGWLGWLLSDPAQPLAEGSRSYDSIEGALTAILRSGASPSASLETFDDARKRCSIEVDLTFKSGLLIRSPGSDAADPDAVHLCSAGQPVLPGTSVAGALRARAAKILRCLRPVQTDAGAWIDRLFGPSLEGTTSAEFKPWASRLRLRENEITTSHDEQQTRVGIDRFTQGVVSGVFVEEQPALAAEGTIYLELCDPEPGEVGLLLLLVKDLISGDLPLGGTSSVGRGVARGEARLTTVDGDVVELTLKEPPNPDTAHRLQGWIDELINTPSPATPGQQEGAAA